MTAPVRVALDSRSKRSRCETPPAAPLDRQAWLKAAAAAIAEDGFNGTRILPLSKRLGVTRGSFYWHFADHAAFVEAFIEYWRDQQLRAVSAYQYPSDDPLVAYAHLLDIVLTDTGAEQKRLKVEFALRGHARRDPVAAKAVAEVDRARTQLFLPLVRTLASSDEEAQSLAHLLLVQLSGAQHAIAGPKTDASFLVNLKQAMLRSLCALYAAHASRRPQRRA
jgi:AcrR family transcriptional regulator